ncbi:hypothetical protein PMAYCL1PPCAC_15013, partial [Pristionchus mayeri]
MLSLTARRLAQSAVGCRTVGPTPRDPTAKYDFVPAEARDKGEIMDVTLKTLFAIEPHTRALGITAENGSEFIDWLVSKSLKYPHSMRIVHKESGKVRFPLFTCQYLRKISDDSDDVDLSQAGEGVQILGLLLRAYSRCQILDTLDVQVLRRELTFVDAAHQRQGIAQYLVHLGLDFDELRSRCLDGIVSEASSIANQTLLAKNGYEELARSKRKEYVRSNGEPVVFPDATETIKLFYLNLKQ